MIIAMAAIAGLMTAAAGIFLIISMSNIVLERTLRFPERWWQLGLWMAFAMCVTFPCMIISVASGFIVFLRISGILL